MTDISKQTETLAGLITTFIKPCPFCGEVPNIFRVPDNRYKKGERNWVIECKDMGCIFERTIPDRSIANLISSWNQRK